MKKLIKTLATSVGIILLVFSAAYSIFSLPELFKDDEFTDSLFPDAEAGFGVNSEDLFANYTSWPSSTNLDPEDTVQQSLFFLYSSNNISSLVDVNGDGLTDIIIHISGGPRKYAVLINNGNLGFDLVYKCVKYTFSTPNIWYGDCAAV